MCPTLSNMPPSKERQSVFELTRVLSILGGLFVVVSGVLDVTSLLTKRNVPSLESVANTLGYSVLAVGSGLVPILGSRYVKYVTWDIVLIVVGIIAYPFAGGFPWKFGPIIVILAGIVGIVARLV